jgi:voltage-gated potassium channel Kch
MIWQLDFARLNYFAFITLTTTGYGDVLPVTQAAQLTSVMVAVIGQIYLAVVMGVLISRFTLQEAEEDEERKAAPAPGVGEGPPEH